MKMAGRAILEHGAANDILREHVLLEVSTLIVRTTEHTWINL